jgi:hypothetical protein
MVCRVPDRPLQIVSQNGYGSSVEVNYNETVDVTVSTDDDLIGVIRQSGYRAPVYFCGVNSGFYFQHRFLLVGSI